MKVRHFLLSGVAAALLVAGTLSFAQSAQTPAPAPRALAVVNIAHVFGALNEKIAGDSEIDAMTKKINDEKRKREDEIDNLNNQLKNNNLFNEDSPEYRKMQDDLLQKSMDLQAFLQFSEQKLLMQQRLKTAEIYRSMNSAIKAYAEANGIGLVLVSDDVDFSNARTTADVQQRIALRKVIYAHPDFDITQKIIEKMNADYKLGNSGTSH